MTHTEIEELLGAYALDAVTPEEADEVERHLQECPRCRAEVEAHRETASSLAHLGADAPEGVWERIAERLDGPPAAPLTRRASSPRRAWPLVAAVAAAVVLVLGLAVQVVRQDDRIDRLAQARMVELQSDDGTLRMAAVVLGNGEGYVVGGNLPRAASDRAYQLWAIVEKRPVSLGVLGRDAVARSFRVPTGTDVLAVTEEAPSGADAPTGAPLVTGRVARA